MKYGWKNTYKGEKGDVNKRGDNLKRGKNIKNDKKGGKNTK